LEATDETTLDAMAVRATFLSHSLSVGLTLIAMLFRISTAFLEAFL